MDNTEGGGFFSSDRRVLDLVCFMLPREPYVQSVVGLGVCWLLRIWVASQEVGRRNRPLCLRNRLLTKSIHSAIGVLGEYDTVPVDLKDLDARDG